MVEVQEYLAIRNYIRYISLYPYIMQRAIMNIVYYIPPIKWYTYFFRCVGLRTRTRGL